MTLTIWTYEARRAGWQALAAPLAAGALGAVAITWAALSHASVPSVDRDLAAVVEAALPLAGALAVIWSVLGDRALELQLSLPRRYRNLVLSRLALALAPTALLGFAMAAALATAGRLPGSHGLLPAQLVWLSPALALAGLGLAVSVAARSAAAGTAVIAVAWLLEQVKHDAFAGHSWARPLFLFTTTYQPGQAGWLDNRLTLLAVAAAAITAAWLLLGRPERLLKEDM